MGPGPGVLGCRSSLTAADGSESQAFDLLGRNRSIYRVERSDRLGESHGGTSPLTTSPVPAASGSLRSRFSASMRTATNCTCASSRDRKRDWFPRRIDSAASNVSQLSDRAGLKTAVLSNRSHTIFHHARRGPEHVNEILPHKSQAFLLRISTLEICKPASRPVQVNTSNDGVGPRLIQYGLYYRF